MQIFRTRELNRLSGLLIIFAAMCLLLPGSKAKAASALKDALPAPGFADEWALDGKVRLFDSDNLFDHINGEAELYFPYGFTALASGYYVHKKNPDVSVVADVYQMGSPLDAFGIYSNYRKATSAWVSVGAEGFASPTQLMFYQDRYFVRLQLTGETGVLQSVLLSCARAISARLPAGAGKPRELQAVKVAALTPQSERYLAKSLLGYAFFRSGIVADAVAQNDKIQIIAIREKTQADARAAFDRYLAYLSAEGRGIKWVERPARRFIESADPLYGGVVMEQSGRYIIGVIRIKNAAAALRILDQLYEQISADTGG